MKKIILFDLDGTIIDSGEGIINAILYVVEKLKLPRPTEAELRSFIGPPLIDSMQRQFHFDSEAAEKAVQIYREYYQDRGIRELSVYENIPQVLRSLSKDHQLYVATTKPELFAKNILASLGLSELFSGIYGANMDGTRSAKADVIYYALHEAKLKADHAIIMIGDREHDIQGAKKNGLTCIGVLYGYGSKAELIRAGADKLAVAPGDILEMIAEIEQEA